MNRFKSKTKSGAIWIKNTTLDSRYSLKSKVESYAECPFCKSTKLTYHSSANYNSTNVWISCSVCYKQGIPIKLTNLTEVIDLTTAMSDNPINFK